MRISITSSFDRLSSNARNTIQQLLRSTLARFSPSITQVSMLIVDENGPRGGVDKLCRVSVVMSLSDLMKFIALKTELENGASVDTLSRRERTEETSRSLDAPEDARNGWFVEAR